MLLINQPFFLLKGSLIASLVRDFLNCFHLDFTTAVYDPESNHVSTLISSIAFYSYQSWYICVFTKHCWNEINRDFSTTFEYTVSQPWQAGKFESREELMKGLQVKPESKDTPLLLELLQQHLPYSVRRYFLYHIVWNYIILYYVTGSI